MHFIIACTNISHKKQNPLWFLTSLFHGLKTPDFIKLQNSCILANGSWWDLVVSAVFKTAVSLSAGVGSIPASSENSTQEQQHYRLLYFCLYLEDHVFTIGLIVTGQDKTWHNVTYNDKINGLREQIKCYQLLKLVD